MIDVPLAWSEDLVKTAEAAGLWDETASMTKRTDAIGDRINYSGRQVLRWIQQTGSVPDASERERLLDLLGASPQKTAVPPLQAEAAKQQVGPSAVVGTTAYESHLDSGVVPVFQSDEARIGYAIGVLEAAERYRLSLGVELGRALRVLREPTAGSLGAPSTTDDADRGRRLKKRKEAAAVAPRTRQAR